MTKKDRRVQPNELLRRARLRLPSPTGSGTRMSREELADVVSRRVGDFYAFDANYVGKLERGQVRWPSVARRNAFRDVLGVGSDGELGFYPWGSSADEAFVAEHEVPLLTAVPAVSWREPLPVVASVAPPSGGGDSAGAYLPMFTFTVRPAPGGGIEVAVHATDDRVPVRLVPGSSERTA